MSISSQKPKAFGQSVKAVATLLLIASCTGCITFAHHAIPADRLPPELRYGNKGERVPVNLALLSQDPPRSYIIGPGDVLSIYIRGLIPPNVDDAAPVIQGNLFNQQVYYPPAGNIQSPSVGVPLQVSEDGTLPLPIVGTISVSGLTIQQAADKITSEIVDKEVVQRGREYVYVTLVRPRVSRIVVIREEVAAANPTLLPRTSAVLAKRGSGTIVDLPAFENDILHALSASGGLPGVDAMNEVWVLRRQHAGSERIQEIWSQTEQGSDVMDLVSSLPSSAVAKKISLWTRPGECPNFNQEDVILQDGDVIYLRPRDREVFYTGGLIVGAEIPLPRDHDLDILEAVALANASVSGPSGASGAAIRTVGPGNIFPPTRAIIVRKLENGQQIAIRVDLNRATRDPLQRIVVLPGDFIMLNYKPGETLTNAALNFFNFNVLLDPTR